jgi:hypothetical protein
MPTQWLNVNIVNIKSQIQNSDSDPKLIISPYQSADIHIHIRTLHTRNSLYLYLPFLQAFLVISVSVSIFLAALRFDFLSLSLSWRLSYWYIPLVFGVDWNYYWGAAAFRKHWSTYNKRQKRSGSGSEILRWGEDGVVLSRSRSRSNPRPRHERRWLWLGTARAAGECGGPEKGSNGNGAPLPQLPAHPGSRHHGVPLLRTQNHVLNLYMYFLLI